MLESTITSEFHNLKDAYEHGDRNVYDKLIHNLRQDIRAYELCHGRTDFWKKWSFEMQSLNLLYVAKYMGGEE